MKMVDILAPRPICKNRLFVNLILAGEKEALQIQLFIH